MAGNSNSGRRPMASALRLLEGNRGRRPINDREPKPKIALPEPPEYLDTIARREWRRVAEELYKLGIMSRLDVGVLAAMCAAHSQEVHFTNIVRRQGVMIGPRSRKVVNPMIKLAAAARRDKVRFSVELGMTPSARAKIRIDEIPKADTAEDEAGLNRDEFLDG